MPPFRLPARAPRLPLSKQQLHLRRSLATPSTPPPPPAPSPSPAPGRTYFDLALIGGGGAALVGLLLWAKGRRDSEAEMGAKEGARGSFTVPVLSQTGTPSTKTLTRLTLAETNARLHEHEASFAVHRPGNPVFRYDTTSLASNSPIEDDSCCVILEREKGRGGVEGDLMLFGTFDGHSGWHTSRLLSTQLASYVARELDLVFRGAEPYSTLAPTPLPASTSSSRSYWPFGSSSSKAAPSSSGLDELDPIVQAALKNAFSRLDDEIVQSPVRLLEQHKKAGKAGTAKERGMGTEENEALNTLLPALSGSCALLAFLDAGRDKLHVAVTGDSRAVMGTWEPGPDGGKWRAEALSADQTGKSPTEVARIQALHPAAEKDTVISRGRILGSLEPSRAFGDARYKWPVGTQEQLAEAFHPGNVRGRPRNYLTPPYVTAVPEVVTVDLKKGVVSTEQAEAQSQGKGRTTLAAFLPGPASASPAPPQATRFVVLATDGLYDRLNNDEIVSLVGAHLSGLRGNHSRQKVLQRVSTVSSLAGSIEPAHAPRQEPTRGEGEAFAFEDGNLATHLVRNALGGAKREQVSVLLSIPSPLSRRYRDDMTVTVVLLGTAADGGEGGVGGVYRREEIDAPPLLAKL